MLITMFGFVTWVEYNMKKKIMSMISNIVWMALFTNVCSRRVIVKEGKTMEDY